MCECLWLIFIYQIEPDNTTVWVSHIISQPNKEENMLWVFVNDEIM